METITRLPALPLIVNDPYFDYWCAADRVTDCDSTHWAGSRKRIRGSVLIDGVPYRFLGCGEEEPMQTVSQTVTPTATEIALVAAGARVTVRFVSALLLDDPDLFSAPVSFVSLKVNSEDGKEHSVRAQMRFYDDMCYDGTARPAMFARDYDMDGLHVAYTGQMRQKVLCHSGDHITIDWGYLYLASKGCVTHLDDYLALNLAGTVAEGSSLKEDALLGYDDIAAINYFGVPTKAWCFRNGMTMPELLAKMDAGRETVLARCKAFDEQLVKEATERGGEDYALILSAAYRHAIAAHKLIADENGEMVLLSKEDDSNGCIGTVDVSYPSIPLFLKYNPELVRALARPVLKFAQLPVWRSDFAPHDVGRYPYATGQVYGLKEERVRNGDVYPPFYLYPASSDIYEYRNQMPVEECGNMLVMLYTAQRADGNRALSTKYIDTLTRWAGYLLEYGEDPGEQLCTDDFAGHLAHNVNLSAKAVVGVKCFALILKELGDERFAEYDKKAHAMAQSLLDRIGGDGDTPLTFDGKGWSMKYNLAWDRVLGLGLLPASFYVNEMNSYVKRVNRYGLPLDSRRDYSKSDWMLWTASMTDDRSVFDAIVAPVARFLRESASRVAFSDWYDTVTGKYQYFIMRSVQGGLFMPLLKL